MSTPITLVLVFLATAGLVSVAMTWLRSQQQRRSLVRSLKEDPVPLAVSSAQRAKKKQPWLVKLGRKASGKKKPQDRELKMKLARAGWDSRTAPLTYSAIRLSLTIALPLLFSVLAFASNATNLEILAAILVGIIVARALPALVLMRKTGKRKKEIRKSLPDALDLMVVCVEAGIGLDAAILRVSDELHLTHPALAYEFRMVNQRVNAGIARTDALRELVSRTGVDDLRSVITTLIQSDKLGVSIGRVLRVASEGLRTRRRQKAEQEARKVPVRMLVPLILFVLPALMLVLLGPAGIHLFRVLKSTM